MKLATKDAFLLMAAALNFFAAGAARAQITPAGSQAPVATDQAADGTAVLFSQLNEALSLVAAAEQGDRSHSSQLAALVAALRADPRVPEYDRYVLVARASALDVKPAGDDQKAKFAAYADLARKLIGEFPQQSEPYASLLALAEDSTDTAAAGQLAVELLDSRAPGPIKVGAGRLLDREAMVKTAIDFSAKDGEGQPLTLAQFRGKVVVVYVWTGQVSGGATWVQRFVAKGNDQVVFIGLNFDPDQKTAQLQMAQVAPGSIQVYDPAGMGGAVATALKITRNRTVYLVDREGVLQDVHGLEHFGEKLAQLLGTARP